MFIERKSDGSPPFSPEQTIAADCRLAQLGTPTHVRSLS